MFLKDCPSCGLGQKYCCKKIFLKAIKEKWKCRKCAVSMLHKESHRKFFDSDAYKNKMSISVKDARKTNSYGEPFKRKCRENKLMQIKRQGVQRTYNPEACRFIDSLNVIYGWNLQHAMNGWEIQVIGYSMDGYDKEKNIVFEYDEPKHRISIHRQKDIQRELRIIDSLHPTAFYRYDEKSKILREILTNKKVICQPR